MLILKAQSISLAELKMLREATGVDYWNGVNFPNSELLNNELKRLKKLVPLVEWVIEEKRESR